MAKIKTESDVNEVLELYQLQGYIRANDLDDIRNMLLSVMTHEGLKSYFQHNNTVYNEREILSDEGEIIIPDRLVVNAVNEAVIIDYKTGKPDRKYHQQLEKYADVINQIGFRVQKKILVYLGDSIKIEEV